MFLLHESREEAIDLTGDANYTSFAALYTYVLTSGKLKNKFNRGKSNGHSAYKGDEC